MKQTKIFIALAGLLASSFLGAQDLQISAYVNRSQIPVNQQFELTVELSGSDANRAPQPEVPDLSQVAAFLGTSTSLSTQIVNSQISITRTFSHHFVATREGKFQIPAIKIDFKGQTFSTAPIDIEIVKGQVAPPPGTNRLNRGGASTDAEDLSNLLFLKAEANKHSVYQNEAVVVSYKIYYALPLRGGNISQAPNMVGFWLEEFPTPQPPRIYSEVINGRQFQVQEIKKVALFPQTAGTKRLEPLAVECEVQLPRRRSRDFFDSVFDDPFFGLGRTARQTIRSNPITITVLPLPEESKPADFSGAVGSFSISAQVDKNQVQTNEPITLKLKISGIGNLKILPQPKIDFPADFEVYDPKMSENIRRDGDQIAGDKIFEYVIIPRFPGNQIIKPAGFSYFDVNSKSYKRIATEPLEIAVAKGKDTFSAIPMGTSKEDVKLIGQDIRFIQSRMPEFQKIGPPFYKSAPFFMMMIFPLLVLGGAIVYRRHLDKMISNEAYARSRTANKMALKRLQKARAQMRSGNPREFYSEVSKALMGFIGDKLNVPAAGLITEEVENVLRARGISNEVVRDYLECLKTCDFMRFAPTSAKNGELKNFFEKAQKVIISLDKEI